MFRHNAFLFGDPSILLDLPFTTDMLDKSMYQVPMRMGEFNGSNTPVITGGALFLPAGIGTYSAIASGNSNLSVFEHLNLKDKKYTIEFETRANSNFQGSVNCKMGNNLNASNNASHGGAISCGYRTTPNTSSCSVSNSSNTGQLSGFNSNTPTTFVKVKLVRTAINSYALYLDDVLVQNRTDITSQVMFLNTGDTAKGVILASTNNAPCYIKNFRITDNGSIS